MENKIKRTESDLYKDENGNICKTITENDSNQITVTTVYQLEAGKTTLRGPYSKLKSDSLGCKKQDRLCCNYGHGFKRCELMTYDNNKRIWICKA